MERCSVRLRSRVACCAGWQCCAADRRAFLPGSTLTARELEVLSLLDEGLSNKQIARRLCIELATVKNHVHHILEKLQVGRRGEATAYLRQYLRFGVSEPAAGR